LLQTRGTARDPRIRNSTFERFPFSFLFRIFGCWRPSDCSYYSRQGSP
jgi:hypothetical protein